MATRKTDETRIVGDGTCCICGRPLPRANARTCSERCRTTLSRARNGRTPDYRVGVNDDGAEVVTHTLPTRVNHVQAAEHHVFSMMKRLDGARRDLSSLGEQMEAMSSKSRSSYLHGRASDMKRLAEEARRIADTLDNMAKQ